MATQKIGVKIDPKSGYVGVGKNDPQHKLDVLGDLNCDGDIMINNRSIKTTIVNGFLSTLNNQCVSKDACAAIGTIDLGDGVWRLYLRYTALFDASCVCTISLHKPDGTSIAENIAQITAQMPMSNTIECIVDCGTTTTITAKISCSANTTFTTMHPSSCNMFATRFIC